jgi:hypothetical protein
LSADSGKWQDSGDTPPGKHRSGGSISTNNAGIQGWIYPALAVIVEESLEIDGLTGAGTRRIDGAAGCPLRVTGLSALGAPIPHIRLVDPPLRESRRSR